MYFMLSVIAALLLSCFVTRLRFVLVWVDTRLRFVLVLRFVLIGYARILVTTLPWTSVRRKSRPWNL